MTDPAEFAAANEQRLRGDLVRGSLWTLATSLLGLPVSFLANLVVVRALGPREFAQFAVLTALYLAAITVTTAGVTVATTQELAVARAGGDVERCTMLIRRCSGFAWLVQAPLMVVVVLVAARHENAVLGAAGVAATLLTVFQAPALVVLSGSARNVTAAKATLAMTVIGQCAVAVAALVTKDADVTWVVRVASLGIAPAVALTLLSPSDRSAVLHPSAPWRIDPAFRATALAFWGLSITGFVLVERTEIFVLQWQGDALAVAVFALATTVTGQLTAPMDSLVGPLAPTSAGLLATDPAHGPRLLRSSLRVSGLAGAFTCAVLLPALIVLVPPVFGHAYGRAVTVLTMLGIASCLDSVATPVRALAFGVRAATTILRLTLAGVVVDVTLAFALIPPFGIGGAVTALIAGQLLFDALLVRFVAGRLGVSLRQIGAAAGVAMVGPPAVVLALLLSSPIPQPVVRAVVASMIGTTVLLTSVRLAGRLRMDDDDLRYVVKALPRAVGGRLARAAVALRVAEGPATRSSR